MLDTGEKMMDHNCLLLGGSILRALLLYVRQAHKVTGVVEKHVLENYVDMLDGRLENKHDRPPTLTFAKRFDLDFFLFGLPTEQDLNKVLHQKVELLLSLQHRLLSRVGTILTISLPLHSPFIWKVPFDTTPHFEEDLNSV